MPTPPPAALESHELAALSIFPLPASALFPGGLLPLHVFEPRYRDLVRDALVGSKILAVARLKPGFESDYQGRPPVFDVCGAGRILEHVEHEDGRYDILMQGIARVRILSELPAATSYRVVRGEVVADLPVDMALGSAFTVQIHSLWRALAPRLPENMRDLSAVTHGTADAGAYADRLAAVLVDDGDLRQVLLSEPDPCERLRLIAERLQGLSDSLAPKSRRGGSSTLN